MLYSVGAVWNTTVLVARAPALIDLYREHQGFLADVLLTSQTMPQGERERFLADWYPELAPSDFCRDVLGRAHQLCLYVWPIEMGWSDLGTPARMAEWLALEGLPQWPTSEITT
jgi:hypothetical protein